jgi:micrococcal nuclease
MSELTFEYPFTLLRVLDGDTVEGHADLGFFISRKVTVRLEGVNAPETKGAEKEVGLMVKQCVERWFKSQTSGGGMRVWLISKQVDKYGRVLGVLTPRGPVIAPLPLNEWLLSTKLVQPYDGGARTAYPKKTLADIAAIAKDYIK